MLLIHTVPSFLSGKVLSDAEDLILKEMEAQENERKRIFFIEIFKVTLQPSFSRNVPRATRGCP